MILPDTAEPASGRRYILLIVLAVSAVALLWAPFVMRGWIPHDEGTLAQSAFRVVDGELPHRDFDEGYTGLVTLGHATLFALFGASIGTLRWSVFAAGLGFAAIVFALLRRVVTPPLAFVGTAVAALWSLPLYFSAMPSWYVLFAATASLWALLRSFEGSPRSWSALSGALAAGAFLCKSTGILAIAAGGLVVLFAEQERAAAPAARRGASARAFAVLVTAAALASLVALAALVSVDGTMMGYLHFVLPPAAIVSFLVVREWRRDGERLVERWRSLSTRLLPFALGAAATLSVFCGYFAARGGLADLLRSVFARPSLQMTFSATKLPPPESLLAALPALLLLLAGHRLPRRARVPVTVALALALGAALAVGDRLEVYRAVWYSLRPLVPIVTIAGLLLLARMGPRIAESRRTAIFGALVVMSFVSLLQFPYPFGVYFAYVAPLVVLAGLAVAVATPDAPRATLAVLLVFYVAFAAIWETGNERTARGSRFRPPPRLERFELPRAAGLRVPASSRAQYESLARVVARRTPPGGWLWASPDCPEVNFLTSTRNPTRTLMDFADPDLTDPPRRARRILARLNEVDARVVVLSRVPSFSGPLDADLARELLARFPEGTEVGKFVVRWRD